MKTIEELEKALLGQVETLSDDSIFSDREQAQALVDRSRAMGELAGKILDIQKQKLEEQRLRLDIVKCVSENGGLYENYLGIPELKEARRIAD